MPYVLEKFHMHRCETPNADEASKTYTVGTQWQCGLCDAIFLLKHAQRDGWYFEKITGGKNIRRDNA